MDLESLKIRVILDGKEATMGIKKLDGMLNRVKGGSKQMNKSFSTLGTTFKKAGLLGRALGVGAIALTMKSFVGHAKEASKEMYRLGLLSERTGVSVKNLVKYRTAISSTGADAGNFEGVLSRISGGVAGIKFGDPRTTSFLASLGINAFENGKQRDANDIFRDLADVVQKMSKTTDKITISEMLSRSPLALTQDIINKMWNGAAGWDKMIQDQIDKTGQLSDAERKNYDGLNQSFSELGATVGVLNDKLVATVAPALKNFVDALRVGAKGAGDVLTAVNESEPAQKFVGGALTQILGTKFAKWSYWLLSKATTPLQEYKGFGSGIVNRVASGVGAVGRFGKYALTKGLGWMNLYQGSEMVGQGMSEFWKGQDPAARWWYNNITIPIGDFLLWEKEKGFSNLFTSPERRIIESQVGSSREMLFPPVEQPAFPELFGVNKTEVNFTQYVQGSNSSPYEIQTATENGINKIKGVNLSP